MARTLVIDDDEASRRIVGGILETAGHSVEYACNGRSGTDLYAAESFDVVVVDLAMPGLNGLRTIIELKALDDGARLIAMSGASADQLDLAERFGARRAMRKPVEAQALREAVDELARDPRANGWDCVAD